MKGPRVITTFSSNRQRFIARRLGGGPTLPIPSWSAIQRSAAHLNDKTDMRLRSVASRRRRAEKKLVEENVPEQPIEADLELGAVVDQPRLEPEGWASRLRRLLARH